MNFFLKLTVTLCVVALTVHAQHIPTGAERQEILDLHNRARSETARDRNVANMPALTWSDAAAQHGRNHLSTSGCNSFEHSDSYSAGFGENIAKGHRSWEQAIYRGWHSSEISCYDRHAPNWNQCSSGGCQCGHYTAVNWARTTVVGCAKCNSTNYYICNYGETPPNFTNQQPYAQNSGAPCSACPSERSNCVNSLCTNGTGGATTRPTQTTQTRPTQTTQTRPTQTRPRTLPTVTDAPRTLPTVTDAPRTLPTVTRQPTPEPSMVLRFRLRLQYASITDFVILEDLLKSQLQNIFGFPVDRVSIDFEPTNNGQTVAIVTIAGARSADEPTVASMAMAVMNGDGSGLNQLGADEVSCQSNCGAFGLSGNNPEATTGLSIGLLAGIAAGAVVLLAVIAVGVFFFLKKRKERLYLDNMANDTPMTAIGNVNVSGAM